jgi:hypothetical protein
MGQSTGHDPFCCEQANEEAMKLLYVVALSVFVLGIALLTYSTASGEEVNIFGLVVRSQILRGLGIITVIFSVITFLAAYDGLGPAPPQEKPRR